MKILKLWHEVAVNLGPGQSVKLKLKSLSMAEAPAYLKQLLAIGKASQNVTATTADGVFDMLPMDFVKESFRKWVRLGEPLQIEEGEVLKDSVELLEQAGTYAFIMDVLLKLQTLATLSEAEGKGSPSPSTPGLAEGTTGDGGGSPVTSTGNGAGVLPSTALEIPSISGPSSSPA